MIKLPSKDRVWYSAVVLLSLTVLLLVGVVQYRWSERVSDATSARLGENLRSAILEWHLDFFRHLANVCLWLRVSPEETTKEDWRQYVRRYQEWKEATQYPDLAQNMFIWESGAGMKPRLLRLDEQSGQFEAVTWSDRFEPLRQRLQEEDAPIPDADAGRLGSGENLAAQNLNRRAFIPGDPLSGWQFEQNIPALVHPIFQSAAPSSLAKDSSPGAAAWIVIELNSEVLRNQILPELSQRYFAGHHGLDYEVAIIAGSEQPHLVYSSDGKFGKTDVPDSDATMSIFSGRLEGQVLGASKPAPLLQDPRNDAEEALQAHRGSAFNRRFWFPLIYDSLDDADWTLVVRHRSGTLEGLIADMRRRDLTISFGVLLLLATSVATIIVGSQRAQRLAKLQIDFVAAISHELRTPLAVITSAGDNLADGLVDSKQQLTQYGSVIRKQARQLTSLVEEILLFASTQKKGYSYKFRRLCVQEIIDSALNDTSGLLQSAHVSVDTKIEPNLPPVMADLFVLSQCLQNFITNAVKYGGQQKWIGIRAHASRNAAGQEEVQIDVSDRGVGIRAAELGRIFEPFYRTPSATASQVRGTGLGLPLAKNIAEAMGGRISVLSSPGRGSTFTLHLPCVEDFTKDSDSAISPEVTQGFS